MKDLYSFILNEEPPVYINAEMQPAWPLIKRGQAVFAVKDDTLCSITL